MKNDSGMQTGANPERSYWFSRHSKSVIFLILTLALLGGYLAFTIPVSVFPATNFPRILIAVDNGVMPTDQMMVTNYTSAGRRCEQRSGPARGPLDHQPRFGGDRSIFRLERRYVPDVAIRERSNFTRTTGTAADGDGDSEPAHLRQLSYHRI